MTPLSDRNPTTDLETARQSRNEAARETTDFDLLVRLWNAGPASRDVALEMADRNRVNARSETK